MPRPIDADKLKERIVVVYESEYNYKLANNLCKWIDQQPTVGGWISVNEQRPESGKHVLLCCEIRGLYSYKSRYQCIGFYAAKHSIPEGKYPEDAEFYDYDEEEDEYYLQEGWYEVIHNWDEYSSVVIDDFVTHWKPQDELPKGEEDD